MSDSRFYSNGSGEHSTGTGQWETRPQPSDEVRLAQIDKSGRLEQLCPKIHEALKLMREHSLTGAQMLLFARTARVSFSDTGDIHGMGQFRYNFNGIKNVVLTAPENDVATNAHVLPHEIMHGMQAFNDSALRYLNWSSRSFAAHGLSMEAAAVTAQFRVAYEMKLNGHPEAWDAQVKLDDPDDRNQKMKKKYVPIAAAFEAAYLSSKAEGLTDTESLKIGGTAAFDAYFESQELRDIYNKKNLNGYLGVMLSGQFDNEFPNARLDNYRVLQLTEVYDSGFLVSGVTAPQKDAEIFGDNTRLRQAFDAIEIERLRRNPSSESQAAYTQVLAEARADSNPYIGVDFEEVADQVKVRGAKDVLAIMNELTGASPAKDMLMRQRRDSGGPAPVTG